MQECNDLAYFVVGDDCLGMLLLSPGDGGVVQSCGLFLQS
ncbi:hypothetical protein BOS5A_200737 [Bosea sp. EC-HK365B]|nr:hypothetical protein BOS5A_200737 [Bosea sp. EC-HK365B]